MSIRKKLKKEKSTKKNIIAFSILLMIFMTYVVMTLVESQFFTGYKEILAYIYILIVDSLLVAVIIKTISDNKFEFFITDGKINIKDSIFESHIIIPEDWVTYIDAAPRNNSGNDMDVLIITHKGKRSRKLTFMSREFCRDYPKYKNAYREVMESFPGKKFYYYIIRKSGSKKYYYLYSMYKKLYNVKFSNRALGFIKDFVQEYNL